MKPKTRRFHLPLQITSICACVIGTIQSTHAAVVTGRMNSSSGGQNWSAAGSWFSGAIPTKAGDIAYYNSGSVGCNITVDTSQIVGQLYQLGSRVLNVNAGSGTTLTLDNTGGNNNPYGNKDAYIGTSAGSFGMTVNVPVVIANTALMVRNGGSVDLTLKGGITGTQNITVRNDSAANSITFQTGSVNNTGTITNSGSGAGKVTISSVIGSNVTGVTQNSATSNLILSGSSSYSGATTVSAGTLQLENSAATGSSAVSLGDGSTLALRADANTTFNVNSFAAASSNRTVNLSADRADGGSGTDKTLVLGSGLSTGTNYVTYNVTTGNGYTLSIPQLLTTGGGGAGMTINTTAGSKLFVEEFRSTYGGGSNPTLNFTGAGDVTIGTTGVTAPTKQFIGTFNQTGTVTLNGPWAYAGVGTSSQINSGTVIFKNNNLNGLKLANIGGGATSPIIDNQSGADITNLSSGGTAGTTTFNGDFTFGSADTTGKLTLGANNYNLGSVAETTRTITIAGLVSNELIISKPIADGTNGTTPTINLTKDGIGILTLSDASTYTGATTVNGGKLVMGDGALDTFATSGVTVAAGTLSGTSVATLAGNGSIGGTVALTAESLVGFKNGGVLAPTAASSGTKLSVTGTTSFGIGSIFEWNMSATDPAVDPVVDLNSGRYGQLAGTGTISGSDAVFKIVLGAGNAFTSAFWNSDKSWDNVFTGSGATTNLSSIFSSMSGSGITYGSGQGTVAGEGYFTFSGPSTLNWTAVPEPTSALAGLLITAGMLRRRRREAL